MSFLGTLTQEVMMTLERAVLCILLPPFAVRERGCGTMLLVGILWLFAWIPGSIAVWIIVATGEPRVVEVHHYHYRQPARRNVRPQRQPAHAKRKPRYYRVPLPPSYHQP